ncbi:MAG: ABC transporter ATP-binding protein [Nitrospirota bacterium]
MSSACKQHILELNKVCFSYENSQRFIHDLTFSIDEGDCIGLLGANGSGKSTILKLASGILKPTSGNLLLWEQDLCAVNNKNRAKLISYLPQMLDFTIPFTVREVVGMGRYPYEILPAMTVEDALNRVGLLDKASARLSDLSGGERRRTFIAMTLLQGAGLLLLDEPLANLDIKYQIDLINLLKHLKITAGISVVMALHDINMALQFEKVMLIREGKIIGIGKPEDVLTEAMLKQAFDVEINVQKNQNRIYFSYEDTV